MYEKYLADLESCAREKEAYSQLLHEAKDLKKKLHEFETQIKHQYKLLALGQQQERIIFQEIETSIPVPQLTPMEKTDDLSVFLAALDKQFALWEGKDHIKS